VSTQAQATRLLRGAYRDKRGQRRDKTRPCPPHGGYSSSSSVSMTTLMLSLASRNEMSSRLLAIENSR
jgi:hypothetical protein